MPLVLPDYPHSLAADEVYQPFSARYPAVLCQHRAELAFVEPTVYGGVGVVRQPADGHRVKDIGDAIPLVLQRKSEGFDIDLRGDAGF